MKLQNREEELQKVYRYIGYAENMFFRPNLTIHTKRVALLSGYICDLISKKSIRVNKEYIIALAHMHDDDEFITGDFVSEEKLGFDSEQKKQYEDDCKNAIDILVENYGEVFHGQDYRKLLEDNNTGTSLEYMIVDLADKLDANLEVCHELFNGNKEFLNKSYLPGYGSVPVYNFSYIRTRKRIDKLQDYLNIEIDLLPEAVESEEILGKMKVTSESDLHKVQTGYQIYNTWIRLQLEHFSQEELSRLYIRSNGDIA